MSSVSEAEEVEETGPEPWELDKDIFMEEMTCVAGGPRKLMVSMHGFYLVELDENKRTDRTFTWEKVEKFTRKEGKTLLIELSGEDDIKLMEKGDDIIKQLFIFCAGWMFEEEYRFKFILPDGSSPKCPPAREGAFATRMETLMKKTGKNMSKTLKLALAHIMEGGTPAKKGNVAGRLGPSFLVHRYKIVMPILDMFIGSLRWLSLIKSITIQCDASYGEFDPLEILATELPKNENITELVLKGRIMGKFEFMLQKFVEYGKSHLLVMHLDQCDMSREHIEAFGAWLAACDDHEEDEWKKLERLRLTGCITHATVRHLMTALDGNAGLAKVGVLVLDKSQGLDLKRVLASAESVLTLSARSSGVSVSGFLSLVRNSKLEKCNIGGNACVVAFPDKGAPRLPKELILLVADDIYWSSNFTQFMKCVSSHEPPEDKTFDVDISGAKMSEVSWRSFFKSTSNFPAPHFREFVWDMNRVSRRFFMFIDRCETLTSLSLNGVFGPGDENVAICGSFLAATTRVRKFSCCGSDLKRIDLDQAEMLLWCLTKNESIRIFDISKHEIGPGLIDILPRILDNNKTLLYLNIEENGVKNVKSYLSLFDILVRSNSKRKDSTVQTRWPDAELKRMIQYDMLTEEACDGIYKKYSRVTTKYEPRLT